MKGNRAGIVTALLARAPAAHVGFRPLQILIWQIEGGLSYSEMPAQSKQLIDRLVPDYKNELRADFFNQLQGKCGKFSQIFPGISGLCGPVNALEQDYQRIHQVLMQDENNYQALAHQFVHVIPGKAPYVGPTYWSRLNSRVYERLVGGAVYGETAKLEVTVLPNSAVRLSVGRGRFKNVAYIPNRGQSAGSDTATGTANVPVCSTIAYPNQTASQVLGCSAEGGPTVQLDTPVVNGLSVTVNGVATPTMPGATITQISWNWGDGMVAKGGQISPATNVLQAGTYSVAGTHSYARAGSYTVTADVTDSYGDIGSASVTVAVARASLVLESYSVSAPSTGFALVLPAGDGLIPYCSANGLPLEGVPFSVNMQVDNESGMDVAAPKLRVEDWSPETDSGKVTPQLLTQAISPSTIPAGTSNVTYTVNATWAAVSQPSALVKALADTTGNQIQNLLDDLANFGKLSEVMLSGADEAVGAASGLATTFQARYTPFVTFYLGLESPDYKVGYDDLDSSQAVLGCSSVSWTGACTFLGRAPTPVQVFLPVFAQPQIPDVFSAWLATSIEKDITSELKPPGELVQWAVNAASCAGGLVAPGVCAVIKSNPSDTWYDSALNGGEVSVGAACQAGGPGPVVPSTKAAQGQTAFQAKFELSVKPATVVAGKQALISGDVRNSVESVFGNVAVELTASENGTQAPPITITTAADGSFKLNFTAPPKPGVVTITARIVGMPNSPVATTKLQVLPKR